MRRAYVIPLLTTLAAGLGPSAAHADGAAPDPAASPARVDARDATPWLDAWSTLLDGPAGCWEVLGEMSWSYRFGRFEQRQGDATFLAILDGGDWRDAEIRSLGEELSRPGRITVLHYPHGQLRLLPLFGRMPRPEGDGNDVDLRANVLSTVLGELTDGAATAYATWDDARGAVILHRELALAGGGSATVDVTFPDGGSLPTALDLTFPEAFRVPQRRIIKVTSASARLRATADGDDLFPTAETMRFTVSALGITGEAAHTIRYTTFRKCGASPVAQPKALGDEPA